MSRRMRAIVVGGGIGGLTAAAALTRSGLDVLLVERAEEFGAVGAGIQLSPNGSRVLRALGMGPALDRDAVRPDHSVIFDGVAGKELGRRQVNITPYAFGAPHELVYRPDLIDGLVSIAARAEVVHGQMVVGVSQDSDGAAVTTAEGNVFEGDLVIGADGIHSVIREQLWGSDAPVFTERAAYRAVVSRDAVAGLLEERSSMKFWGPQHGHHFVIYPIRRGEMFNITAVTHEYEWTSESWATLGDIAEFQERYAGFASPIPEVTRAVPEVYKWALHDRPALPQWSKGRVTLLGDSCHPMVPFLGQGAVMAIEDAAVLARELGRIEGGSQVPEALAAYEAERLPRATEVQQASRSDDPQSWGDREWLFGYTVDGFSGPIAQAS